MREASQIEDSVIRGVQKIGISCELNICQRGEGVGMVYWVTEKQVTPKRPLSRWMRTWLPFLSVDHSMTETFKVARVRISDWREHHYAQFPAAH